MCNMPNDEIRVALNRLQKTSDENTSLLKELVVTVRGDQRFGATGLVNQVAKNEARIEYLEKTRVAQLEDTIDAWRNRAIGISLIAVLSGIISGLQLLVGLLGG